MKLTYLRTFLLNWYKNNFQFLSSSTLFFFESIFTRDFVEIRASIDSRSLEIRWIYLGGSSDRNQYRFTLSRGFEPSSREKLKPRTRSFFPIQKHILYVAFVRKYFRFRVRLFNDITSRVYVRLLRSYSRGYISLNEM